MFEDKHYRNPFLKEVIVRIDFPAPAYDDKSLPKTVANKAINNFPIQEERKALSQELTLSPSEIHHKRQEFTEWHFHGIKRQKKLIITPRFIAISYSRYTSFEELKDGFLQVTSVMFEHDPDIRASRLGLRYINHIDIPKHDPYEWGDLINRELLGLFEHFSDRKNIINRIFHIVEYKYEDDIQLKFQFGVPNPDFPAPVRAPLFVLDMDAYYNGLQDKNDISDNLNNSHERIQHLFENSITDNLRRLMDG